ncbi:exocyst complex component Sec10-like protein [Exophiala viscosa]|uniref:Exocyst complex component Sec10-like protein n=1 Tax=Exophiala viscosa TaxID=2486360 RepID=A0AAN6DZ53_9EURO|nr:exocyst complex component Sec10-like protein [Exophiala viscosa]
MDAQQYLRNPPADQPTRSIFPKGPAFNLDDFSNRDFIAKDFIESLTESAQSSNRRSNGANAPFDPKPLIRTFEQASRRLDELSGELEHRENELSAAVRRAEAQHASNTETLGRKLNQTVESFQKLDTSLKSERGERWAGNVAVETGRRLEELDRQRTKALDAHFLIECWDEVSNRGEVTLLENLRRSGTGEGKIRSANIARQLLRISQRLDPKSHAQANGIPKTNGETPNGVSGGRNFNTREVIEKFIETLENDMLKLFDDFYRRQNFEEMKNCAIVLQDFNGGASVQAAFVNQHQFFIDRSNLVTDEVGGDQETWMRLSDPDAELPGVEPGLQSLIDEVKVVVQEESAIIKRAFPYPEQVLGKFVQRVFQQSIQQRLELVLEKAESESTLAYLRLLQAARSYISILVDDLKAHGLTEHPESVTSQTSQLLDQQLDELFTPYFGGSAYIDKEKHNLQELYKSLLFKFELFHSRRQKEPKTYLASLRNRGQELLASAREATDAYVKSLDLEKMSPTQKRILLSVAGLNNTDKAQPDVELSEADGRLNVVFAKRMLKWLAEGVRRGLELGGGSETPKDVAALLNLILKNLIELYVEVALEAAADAASSAEYAKRDPDLSYLASLRTAVHITHLVQSCINTLLIPLASTSLTTRRDMEKNTRTAVARIEDQINTIEQQTIDGVLNWTSRLLSNQSRTDFRPRAETEAISLEQAQSPTCNSVCRFLGLFHDTASQSFDGANLSVLLTEVAVGFRAQLLQHFTKYQVNRIGGVMLARDMSRYVQMLRSWGLDDTFKASLEVLTELASIFVLLPDALKERLRGQVLGNLGKENLRPYLLKRDDYMEVGMQSLLHSL